MVMRTWDHLLESADNDGLGVLWAAFLAGPLAWTFNQGVGYAVMKPVCLGSATYLLWLIAAIALCVTLVGAWTGWRWVRRLRTANEDGEHGPDRTYFLAILTVAFNGLIAILIVASLIPQFVLSPCE